MVNLKQAKGITLIALVITIIVLLILAGTSISMLTEENGIITKASEAEFKAELSKIKEDFDLYVTNKCIENSSFEQGTLNAGKSILTYNTMPEGEKGNIYTVLANSSEKYIDSFEVIKGELIYSSQNSTYLKWALEMGLKINPYLIVDGELLSSETNLMLMDENTGTIVIPETVTKIGDGAFRDVTGLKTIIIPGTVREIGNYAFSGNPTLENVIIEEGVEKIGDFAFQDCTALKTIHIANSVSSIGSTCFGECTALTDINFPTSLTVIPYRMLSQCSSVTKIILPEGIVSISSYAFEYCTNLNYISIPSTVTSIDGSAFLSDYKLIDIDISSNNKNYSFINSCLMSADEKTLYYAMSNTTQINIPNSVETIGDSVFYNRNKLKEISIPSNVKTIQSNAFYYSVNLQKVEIPSSIESIDSTAFTRCNSLTEIIIDKAENEVSGSPWGCPYGLRAVKWKY